MLFVLRKQSFCLLYGFSKNLHHCEEKNLSIHYIPLEVRTDTKKTLKFVWPYSLSCRKSCERD